MKLREHMPANAVKRHVGEGIWRDYLTVTVERDPWHRLVSLWRWRCRHHRLKVDFESFLEAIESGSRQRELAVGARRWSNRPFYEIDGQRAVDQVLQFDTIGGFCPRALGGWGVGGAGLPGRGPGPGSGRRGGGVPPRRVPTGGSGEDDRCTGQPGLSLPPTPAGWGATAPPLHGGGGKSKHHKSLRRAAESRGGGPYSVYSFA